MTTPETPYDLDIARRRQSGVMDYPLAALEHKAEGYLRCHAARQPLIDALVEALAEVQWNGGPGYHGYGTCPGCRKEATSKHEAWCMLKVALDLAKKKTTDAKP